MEFTGRLLPWLIFRDARWGRSMEGAGKTPWYGSQVAKARVERFSGY